MKPEKPTKKTRLEIIRKPHPVIATLLLIMALLLSGYSEIGKKSDMSDLWEPLHKINRSSRNAAAAAAIEKKVENIMEVFRKAVPFNPPKGFAAMPRVEYLKPLSLPGNTSSPEPVHFRVAVRMPPESKDIVASVNVWINDPYNLLGEPLLRDNQGDIFLLPPDVGTKSGQKIISRMAHPPGYDNEYPCSSMFPLWSDNQEPFLRSVVRPSFGLAKGTVTTLFTAGNQPFWKPVSQERWINAMIAAAEGVIGEMTSGISAAEELNISEQQLNQMRAYLTRMKEFSSEEGIMKRYNDTKANVMTLYEMMKQTNPAQAEEFYRKSMDDVEKMRDTELAQAGETRAKYEETEEKLLRAIVQREGVWQQMKAYIERGDWDAIDKLGSEHKLDNLKLIADAGRSIGRMRAELAGLSPAERRAPAYGFLLPPDHPLGTQRQVVAMVFKAERASGLAQAGAKGARAIVSVDPDFFNFSDDGAPIKLMAVEYSGRNTITYDNNKRNLLDDIWQYLDWQTLRGMIAR